MMAMKPLPRRAEIPAERTWDKTDVYPSDEAWEMAFDEARQGVPALGRFRGQVGRSAAMLLEALRTRDEWQALVWRLRWYPAMGVKTDVTDAVAAERHQRAMALIAQVDEALAYMDPELLTIDAARFATLCEEEPALGIYAHALDKLRRRASHIRPAEVEAVIAAAGDLASSSYETYKALVNGELRFGAVTDAYSGEIAIHQATIHALLRHPQQATREASWANYADGNLALRDTLAGLLGAAFKRDVFYARARGYPSALDAALDGALLPRAVFDNLMATSLRYLPLWHRYFEVKRRALGVDALRGCDLDAPLAHTHRSFAYDEAREIILASVAPLGAEYVGILRRGLYDERWVDWAANVGKAGGAEQSGAYGLHPYVLTTYTNDLLSVSVLAHELGHAMHTHYCNAAQPPIYDAGQVADYLGETASTFGQALLRAHLLSAHTADLDLQRDVLDETFTYLHRYLLLMPLLARLEVEGHERIERGDGLPADWLSERTLALLAEAYGPAVALDPARDGILWAQFAHLYLNFYTYQYALGIAAAAALADGILREGEPMAARYIEFLKVGDSIDPLDAWRLAGVDMAAPEPIDRAYAALASMIDRLEAILAKEPPKG
ncbi:MAG TPA: M3 family metallopeptidase [Ktedonobacterales bacterium]